MPQAGEHTAGMRLGAAAIDRFTDTAAPSGWRRSAYAPRVARSATSWAALVLKSAFVLLRFRPTDWIWFTSLFWSNFEYTMSRPMLVLSVGFHWMAPVRPRRSCSRSCCSMFISAGMRTSELLKRPGVA